LHYAILLLVLTQIVVSNFVEISDDGVISHNVIEFYGTWTHISIGLFLVLLAIIFIIAELKKHGFRYFYPYVSGDFSQLKRDIEKLKSLELPDASAGGLAAIVQGLGLGALLLVVSSGAIWFLLWSYDSSLAGGAQEVHELLTGLIEAYVVGHGSIGLLHIFLAYKEQKSH
jgi:cytochrome b561